MKKLVVFGFLIWLSSGILWAKSECNPQTEIPLKTAKRNWIGDFNKLATKYNTLDVKRLRPFFYDGTVEKECIDFTKLQELKAQVNEVFKGRKDKDLIGFVIGIAGAAKANKPLRGDPNLTGDPAIQKASTKPVKGSDTVKTPEQRNGNLSKNDTIKTAPKTVTPAGSDPIYPVSFWVSIGLGVLALSLGGWALTLNSKIKKQKDHFEKTSREEIFALRDDLQNKFDKVSKEKFDRLTTDYQKLNQTNDELMQKISELEGQAGIGALATATSASIQTDLLPQPTAPAPEPPLAKAFFLSTPTPTSDGLCTFLDHRKAQFDPTSSLYRFELVSNNESEARFRFESTSGTVKGALSSPDTYLQPACEYDGLDSKATYIDTDELGKATRQGNVWKVTQKARIKFV